LDGVRGKGRESAWIRYDKTREHTIVSDATGLDLKEGKPK